MLGEEVMKLPQASTPKDLIHFDEYHDDMIGNDQVVLQYREEACQQDTVYFVTLFYSIFPIPSAL